MSEPQNICGVRFFCHGHPKAKEANSKLCKGSHKLQVCLSHFLKPSSHRNLEVQTLRGEQELIIVLAKDLQAPPFPVMVLYPATLTEVKTQSHQTYTITKGIKITRPGKLYSCIIHLICRNLHMCLKFAEAWPI